MMSSLGARAMFLSAAAVFATAPARAEEINAVVGDASWVAKFGRLPGEEAKEHDRIRVHLDFVLERLRGRDDARWSSAQRSRRRASLSTLQAYAERRLFPARTGDAFPGRRPRFIDDAGVHCAVGHLIAASGAPELAQELDDRYEYALVRDMRSPALADWAERNGFELEELAMIQPGYEAPPTAESTRRDLEEAKDAITIECAKRHEPQARIKLSVRGDDRGKTHLQTDNTRPFARCFVEQASGHVENGGGAYDPSPEPYRFQAVFELSHPQALFERALARIELGGNLTSCLPRPGAIPSQADVQASSSTETGLSVAVSTKPGNAEIDACLGAYVKNALRSFDGGKWSIHTTATKRLWPVLSEKQLEQAVRMYAPGLATDCYPKKDPPKNLRVTVTAKLDAKQFDIELDAADAELRACISGRLQEMLQSNFSASRSRPDQTHERYFRIDANARTSYAFAVEPPDARERRMEDERRERKKHRYDF